MKHPTSPVRQGGAALIIVLLLLLVVTILGLASLRGTILEERMSANLYDRSLAFQAVEQALREGEAKVSGLSPLKDFPSTNGACSNGLCYSYTVPSGGKQRWLDSSFNGWVNGSTVSNGTVSITPQYYVEYQGMAPGWIGCDHLKPANPKCYKPRFRITARTAATGSDGLSQVMLQSTYASP